MSKVLDAMARGAARTANDAASCSTTTFGPLGRVLDYWSKAGSYRGRKQSEVDADMAGLFADPGELVEAAKAIFSVRLVTRVPKGPSIRDGLFAEPQTGSGQRDEFGKAFSYLVRAKPLVAERLLPLVPVFGSWGDLFREPLLSAVPRPWGYRLCGRNLQDALLLKYLPQARSRGKDRCDRDRARTRWAKGFMRFLGVSPRQYRKLKARGEAHRFQRQMSSGEWDGLEFDSVPGRAFLHLTTRTGKDGRCALERHGQAPRLLEWLKAEGRLNVKFTGFPHELVRAAESATGEIQRLTLEGQWNTLLQPLRGCALGNTLVAMDTSGSMSMPVAENVRAVDVCLALGLAFAELNCGAFRGAAVMFDSTSRLIRLSGSFVDRVNQIRRHPTAWGSTNFQSVIDLLVRVRREHPEIPVTDFPRTLLVVSDMQFNPAGCGDGRAPRTLPGAHPRTAATNHDEARRKLAAAGLPDVRVVWWQVNGSYSEDFPAQAGDAGTYLVSGWDPNCLRTLLGLGKAHVIDTSSMPPAEVAAIPEAELVPAADETPMAGMLRCLSQPIFNLIEEALR